MESLYREYKDDDKVAMYFIYISEAHPAKQQTRPGKQTKPNQVARHKNIEDRVNAAIRCVDGLKLSVPILIGDMDGKTQRDYRASPAGTVVIDKDRKIAYHARGPRGSQPEKAKAVIKKLLSAEK